MRLAIFVLVALQTFNVSAAPFTDVTKESGVSEIVAKHYEQFPKWWLSGLTRVYLDGDGVELHVASHSGPTVPALAALNDGQGHFSVIDPAIAIPRGPR